MSVPREVDWHFLTPGYPPDFGGVSDYTRLVAEELAARQHKVHVWTGGDSGDETTSVGPIVHRRLGKFEPRYFEFFSKALDSEISDHRLVVQYVPHGFGFRAMNIEMTRWLYKQSKRTNLRMLVMFHEVLFPYKLWPLHHNLIAWMTRRMLRNILKCNPYIHVSTPAWTRFIEKYASRNVSVTYRPIPSNIPSIVGSRDQPLRSRWCDQLGVKTLIGHFGTFGQEIFGLLLPAVLELEKATSELGFVLIGKGAENAATKLIARCPSLRNRIVFLDGADHRSVGEAIGSCNIMLQPYPDGITTRRGSAMAALANNTVIATNDGEHCEEFWAEEGLVSLAKRPGPECLRDEVLNLCRSAERRLKLSSKARAYYDRRFSVGSTVDAIRLAFGDIEPKSDVDSIPNG